MFTVISLFLLNHSIALELSINSPDTVEIDKDFLVGINLDSSENYDVKIFVHNSPDNTVTRDEYISQIYNLEKNSYQSSWNYLLSSFPSKKEYKIKILDFVGERQICARLRKTGTDTSISKCNSILVLGNNDNTNSVDNTQSSGSNEEESRVTNKNNDKDSEESDGKAENGPAIDNNKNIVPLSSNSQDSFDFEYPSNQLIYEDKEIILKSSNNINNRIKSLQNEVIVTKKQKTSLFMFYIFNLFLVFIILLIILKRV